MDEIFSKRLKELEAKLAQARIDLQNTERLVYNIDKSIVITNAAIQEVLILQEHFTKKETVVGQLASEADAEAEGKEDV